MSATAEVPATTAPDTPQTFSERLRAATWSDHQAAEDHGFTRALMDGTLSLDGYTGMVAQHYFAYVALEETGRRLAGDPVAGRFHYPELERVPALVRDLEHLLGADWRDRIAPTPATRTYAARIEQMADHPEGFVAHHYTRYMGDVSGGQFIRRTAASTYGLTDAAGVSFYVFDALGSLPRFRTGYRERLDSLDLGEAAAARLVAETRLAYQLNTEVFADLGRMYAPGAGADADAA
ncbi:heme oxygenase (biliverdin-producing) [Nocardiopsis sp. HUAS JQ3]|uniref:biliverdin-producing heme oxygenase n=1 Tax=Nocardiopsis sp. HUAS JQ3 TaxID=3061629 RepID=UPI0023A9174F|nr:biliverdin-producing heme oxygenase [Nocardiopsis sp. HUAS JQ3]WDZ92125.1 biliverdin-producing heme oxygenase [Nocardiopsis sp. HUAS JQ3]